MSEDLPTLGTPITMMQYSAFCRGRRQGIGHSCPRPGPRPPRGHARGERLVPAPCRGHGPLRHSHSSAWPVTSTGPHEPTSPR